MTPDAAPPSKPPPPRDLTDAEFAELDELLAATPEPLAPCDVVMLDGYLCGVIVQPVLLEPAVWLPPVFDLDGRARPDDMDPVWRDRAYALIQRRHAALNRALAEDGGFDPMLLEPDDEATPADGDDDAATVATPVDPAVAALHPTSRPLWPWVAGFDWALANFSALDELDNEAVMAVLARIYRHLPAETDEQRAIVATLDREQPLTSVDDAVGELVACVADLWELTREARYRVATVRRDAPKLGRNDPCSCGSGKKFKQCHGR